jgi:hypothetical protein
MTQASRWTRADVQAEVDRSLARATQWPLLEFARTWKRLRDLCHRAGFSELLEPYKDKLVRGLGETIDWAPAPEHTTCARCGLSWVPHAQTRDHCPQCAWQGCQQELETLRSESIPRGAGGLPDADGWMPLGFGEDWDRNGLDSICVTACPRVPFLPRLLCVSPSSSKLLPGALLTSFRCGWREYVENPLPLDVFSPSAWANKRLMAQAQWDCEVVPIAVQITLGVQLPKSASLPESGIPVRSMTFARSTDTTARFAAVLWGKVAS